MTAFLAGFGAGFMVSMQLGPLSLFLIRSTLRGTLAIGLAIGAGIAVVDALYAAAGAAGAAPVLSIDSVRTVFGLVGAVVLVALGARTLWSAFRVRLGGESDSEIASPRRAFATALAATASNPLTIASWAGVFAAASTAGIAASTNSALTFVAGVGIGSMAWVTLLALGVAGARARVGPRLLRTLDATAGTAIVAFGGLLAWRTLREGS
ncbi:MAG: LysE family translocator [Gaiellaceae bacterium]